MSFDKILAAVLKTEGGYVNHPADRGGATNMGITQQTYAEFLAASGRPWADVRGLSMAEASAIYRKHYWQPARCDDLPERVRFIHFDAAVNHGTGRAAKMLQAAAWVDQDGKIGPATLAAVRAMDAELLLARYIAARYKFYGQIINRDRSQLAFIAGWMNRMAEFA
jgi:lysozyme family protein